MADTNKAPASKEEALAAGYRPIEAVEGFEALTQKSRKGAGFVTDAVDCTSSAPGTKCFDYTYPNGTHVVGYCENGVCKLYARE